jgi:CRISPR-associated protein Csb2
MEQTLRISVTLLNNRFHGEDWPSSPARLFRALVAGSMTGRYRERWPETEPALRWLERLPAPEIFASDARLAQTYRISVPNNDMDIAAREWRAGRYYDPANLRTMKQVKPFLLNLDGPHIAYTWRPIEIDGTILSGLRYAVHSLHTLGWGIDMAFAEISVGNDGPLAGNHTRWVPTRSGERLLPVAVDGSLDDLQDTYRRFLTCLSRDGVNPDTRPSVYRLQGYSGGGTRHETVVFELRTAGGDEPYSKPAETAMVIAAWMRHAVSGALLHEGYDPALVNAMALGHSEENQFGCRLSYLPLPSIGHQYTDGRIRRVMITGPADRAEEMIRFLARKCHGLILTENGGKEVCRLVIPESAKVTSRYLGTGHNWETVTPLILHGYNALRGQISNRKTERLLLQAFETAGFEPDNIKQMTFQPAPFWPNTGSARSYRVPAHLKSWPRYHVSVVFRKQVTGPVIAGLGRHYGIGTLACPD